MTDAGVRVALDTATDRLSLAADRPGHPPVAFEVPGARRHGAVLLPLLDRALRELRATRADLRLVAVSDGPGSFTGIRIGVAAAKALTAGGPAQMAVAPSLLVRAAGHGQPGETVVAASPALRGEVFAGVWRLGDRAIECLVPARPFNPAGLASLPTVSRVVGEAPDGVLEAFAEGRSVPLTSPAPPDAAVLLRLLAVPGGAIVLDDPGAWDPESGRPAEAQARWERTHGRRLPDPPRSAR